MKKQAQWRVGAALAAAIAIGVASAAHAQYEGWTIPSSAKSEVNPMAGKADTLRKGRAVFKDRCQRCHGAEGHGNGPEAEKSAPPADLTKLDMRLHPDGVIFYKVWNGHEPSGAKKGKMPAFKTQMVKDDVWRVVEFVKTLAKPTT